METFSCGILPGFIFVISSEGSNLQVLALRLLLWGWAWVGKFLWNIGQTFCQYHFPKLDTSVLLVEISLCGALRQLQLKEEWQNRKQSSLHNITFLVLRQEKISLLVFSPKYQQMLRRQYCLNGNLKKAGRPSPMVLIFYRSEASTRRLKVQRQELHLRCLPQYWDKFPFLGKPPQLNRSLESNLNLARPGFNFEEGPQQRNSREESVPLNQSTLSPHRPGQRSHV